MRRYRELLAQPGMIRWSIVRVLTRLPILAAPISFIMLSRTQLGTYGPGAWMSGADVLAECIAAPLLGRRLDRYPMRKEVLAALTVNAASLLAIVAGVHELPTAALVVLAGVAGGSISGLIGGLRSQLTKMVPADAVTTALSWESVLADVVFTVAPAVATALALGVDGRLPLVLMSAGSVTAMMLVPGLPGINDRASTGAPSSPAQLRILLSAWPIYLTSAAAMFIAAEVEIALSPLLQQSHQSIGWAGPLLSIFAAASVLGGLCYGLRDWPGSHRSQSLVLLTADAILVAAAAFSATVGLALMVLALAAAGVLQAGMITARNLSLHTALPEDIRSTGNSLMYTASCIGYGLSSAAIGLFATHRGALRLIMVSCLLTVVIALLSSAAELRAYRRHPPSVLPHDERSRQPG